MKLPAVSVQARFTWLLEGLPPLPPYTSIIPRNDLFLFQLHIMTLNIFTTVSRRLSTPCFNPAPFEFSQPLSPERPPPIFFLPIRDWSHSLWMNHSHGPFKISERGNCTKEGLLQCCDNFTAAFLFTFGHPLPILFSFHSCLLSSVSCVALIFSFCEWYNSDFMCCSLDFPPPFSRISSDL